MSKTTKTVLIVGGIVAALSGCCMLCLVAGVLVDAPTTTPETSSVAPSTAMDGRYKCLSLNIMVAAGTAQVEWQIAALPPFTIAGDGYETASGSGSVTVADGVATFDGGPYDGWRGATGSDTTGTFFLFDGKEHHRVRTDGAKRGDFKCYRQRD